MNSPPPAYSRPIREKWRAFLDSGQELTGGAWWLTLVVLLILLGGFSLAVWLEPDERGYGTHQQLGFPPCTFRFLFGVPCPSCGGTTAFTLFVRGRWSEAIQANPAVFLFAVVCALAVPWCGLSLKQKRCCGVHDPVLLLVWLMLTLAIVSAVYWGSIVFLS